MEIFLECFPFISRVASAQILLKVQLVRMRILHQCVFNTNPITNLSRCISRTNQTRKRTQNGSAAGVGSTKRYIGLACLYLDFGLWHGFVVYLARWISNRKVVGSRANLCCSVGFIERNLTPNCF